jgi:hypothetical protein
VKTKASSRDAPNVTCEECGLNILINKMETDLNSLYTRAVSFPLVSTMQKVFHAFERRAMYEIQLQRLLFIAIQGRVLSITLIKFLQRWNICNYSYIKYTGDWWCWWRRVENTGDLFILAKLFQCVDYADWTGMINVNRKQYGRNSAVKVLFWNLPEGTDRNQESEFSYLTNSFFFTPFSRIIHLTRKKV